MLFPDRAADEVSGMEFFLEQSFTGIAVTRSPAGSAVSIFFIPTISGAAVISATPATRVSRGCRGRHIGEALVRHCLAQGKELGFRILQFNAVVRSNTAALSLYRKLGFVQLGIIPGGFRMKDGSYEDIIPHYHTL